MYKKISASVFILCAINLTACTDRIPLSPQNAEKIKRIYVQPEVQKPEQMVYIGKATRAGMSYGLLGISIGKAFNQSDQESTQKWVQQNHIDISDIVYKQWKHQLSQAGFSLKQPADAILVTNLTYYGISIPHVFTSKFTPEIKINAKLIRNNQIIWQDSLATGDLAPGQYTMDEIKKDPKKLYAMWDKASGMLISILIQNMKK